jgi:hypothetical protein
VNVEVQYPIQQSVVRIKLILFTVPQYFSYILVASFIGGGNRRTQREPPTMGKQLVSFITITEILWNGEQNQLNPYN